MNSSPYKYGHTAAAKRAMGADSRPFPQEDIPDSDLGRKPTLRGVGSGTLDTDHRGAMTVLAAVLSQLQNRPSPLPTVV